MKRILTSKYNLLYISFLLLTLYPLLKYIYSSIILIIFLIVAVFTSIKNNDYSFSKPNTKIFAITTLFFFILIASAFYSSNIPYAFEKLIQLIPLLLVPFVIIYFRPKINNKMKTKALNMFMIVNLLYSFLIFGIFIFNSNISGIEKLSLEAILLNYDKAQFVLNESIQGGFFENIVFFHKPYFSMGFVFSSVFALHESIRFIKKDKIKSSSYLLLFFYFSLLMLYVFSFPNIIALFLCIICLFIFYNRKVEKKKLLISGFILLSAIVLGAFYKSQDRDVKRGLNFINSIVYQDNVEGNDPRIEIYNVYTSLYKKSSTAERIFGYGIGNTQKVLRQELEHKMVLNKTKNLLFFNEEFNDKYWYKNNIDIIPNQSFSPDGFKKADELRINTNNLVSYNISKSILLEKGSIYTLSVFTKKATSNFLVLRLGNLTNTAYFNIDDGLVSSTGAGIINASIKNTSGPWYRCSISIKGEGKALAILGISNKNKEYKFKGNDESIYLWGAQIEKNETPTMYEKNNIELTKLALKDDLNTHNNYLFFLMSGGIICLFSVLMSMFALFYISIKNKNIFQLSFCIILGLNFLTENILSRHWGLMFVSMMLIILFTNNEPKNKIKRAIT